MNIGKTREQLWCTVIRGVTLLFMIIHSTKYINKKNQNKHTNSGLKSVFLGIIQKLNIFFFHCSGATRLSRSVSDFVILNELPSTRKARLVYSPAVTSTVIEKSDRESKRWSNQSYQSNNTYSTTPKPSVRA